MQVISLKFHRKFKKVTDTSVNELVPLSEDILDDNNRWVTRDTVEDEILQAVRLITPGPDGWHAIFSKNVGTSLVRTLPYKDFFPNMVTYLRKLIEHIFSNS